MNPNLLVSQLPGVGPNYARKLKKLGIVSLENLIYHFPFRYDDFSNISQIQNVEIGEKLSIQGVVWQIKNVRTRTGKFITNATVADSSGTIDVIWFNQPYLTKTIKAGMPISISGKTQQDGNRITMISPSYELLRSSSAIPGSDPEKGPTLHTGRLVPIYPETEGLSSKWLRARISDFLPQFSQTLQEYLPGEIVKTNSLLGLKEALSKIHFPKTHDEVTKARERLGFDELFTTQLISQTQKYTWQTSKKAKAFKIDNTLTNKFIESLPFELTQAQKRSIDEITGDLSRQIPTNRLLEGDVGSGKTVVAAFACLAAAANGFDSIIAAPTEILAFQHHKTLTEILKPFKVKVGIWTGAKKEAGQVTCGTHAFLTTKIEGGKVGLIVVDEQHRFGVAQRAKLFLDHSKGLTAHFLTMTATPIPRTLALTIWGDLDLSILDEMPKGRQKISTFVVPNRKRNDAYKFIGKQVTEGAQAFIITPFVEPSESMTTVKAAKVEFEKLKSKFSAAIKLDLLHGRLKSKEKEKVIEKFKSGKTHILVSTPVVEVGIDVPNATIMMIESADRFGLAQLHQLRGRVGRGSEKSYCFIFTDSQTENSIKRLKAMEKVHVGFELAEIDLKIRGSGELFGLKQSGFENFKVADISNQALVAKAQREAKRIIENDPRLEKHQLLHDKIESVRNQLSQPS